MIQSHTGGNPPSHDDESKSCSRVPPLSLDLRPGEKLCVQVWASYPIKFENLTTGIRGFCSLLNTTVFDLQLIGGMMDCYEVFTTAKKVTDNIACLVPRKTNIDQPGRSGREGGGGASFAQQEDEDID